MISRSVLLKIHKKERLYLECEISQFAWNIKRDFIVILASLTHFEAIYFALNLQISCSREIKWLTFKFGVRAE